MNSLRMWFLMSDGTLCFVSVLTKDLTKADGHCVSTFHLAEVLGNFPAARHASCASDKNNFTNLGCEACLCTNRPWNDGIDNRWK